MGTVDVIAVVVVRNMTWDQGLGADSLKIGNMLEILECDVVFCAAGIEVGATSCASMQAAFSSASFTNSKQTPRLHNVYLQLAFCRLF